MQTNFNPIRRLHLKYPRVLEKYFYKKYLLVREGLGAFIARADDKILSIAHLLFTQIPLGPNKNFVTAVSLRLYSRSRSDFHDKISHILVRVQEYET